MFRTNALLFALLLAAGGQARADADWLPVVTGLGPADVAIDLDSIRRRGTRVTYRERQSFRRTVGMVPRGATFFITMEVECVTRRNRQIASHSFLANGRPWVDDEETGAWSVVAPGSAGERMTNIACRQ